MEEHQYELYLNREEFDKLLACNQLSSSLLLSLRIAEFSFEHENFCRIWPDIPMMLEIVGVLNYIPCHYHVPLADALRDYGWTREGRKQL